MVVSVVRTQRGCIVRQKVGVLRGDWWSMVGACSAHKPWWSSLVMVAWACKGGVFCLTEGSKLQLWLVLPLGHGWCLPRPEALVVSSRDVCLGLLLAGCQARSHNRTVNRWPVAADFMSSVLLAAEVTLAAFSTIVCLRVQWLDLSLSLFLSIFWINQSSPFLLFLNSNHFTVWIKVLASQNVWFI